MKILIVLGSPNDGDGNLSQMATSRCEKCLEIYEPARSKIFLTGGFGPHFNNTSQPHWSYLQTFLLKRGVLPSDIVAGTLARHSVEDATLLVPILKQYQADSVTVITSDYHLKRAKIIFEAVFKNTYNFQFSPANSEFCDKDTIDLLIKHETAAIEDLETNGVRF